MKLIIEIDMEGALTGWSYPEQAKREDKLECAARSIVTGINVLRTAEAAAEVLLINVHGIACGKARIE